MSKTSLLIAERPLQVLPGLAARIGLNEAIVLQQIHYWLDINKETEKNFEDGCYWSYNSYEVWQERNFPFWSLSTVKRVFKNLKNKGLIRAEQRRKRDYDRRVWVTINYDAVAELDNCPPRECQNDTVGDSKMEQSTYTETNTETNDSYATAETADGNDDLDVSPPSYAIGEYVKASKEIEPELDIKPGTIGVVVEHKDNQCVVDFVGVDEGFVMHDDEIRRTKVNKPFKPSQQQRVWGAIVDVFNYDVATMTETKKGTIGRVASELITAEVKPDEVEALYKYVKRKQFSTFSHHALLNYTDEFRPKTKKRPNPSTAGFAPPSLKPDVTRKQEEAAA